MSDNVSLPLPGPIPLPARRQRDERELRAAATAVLIAARGCSEAQASDELFDVARRHHLTIGAAARTLLDLVAPPRRDLGTDGPSFAEWTTLRAQFHRRRPAS